MKKILPIVALSLSLVPYASSDASACAAVGRGRSLEMVGEEALIVWDARERKEHFIRTAAFAGADDDFGFLVPTPAVPELAEVNAGVFAQLFALYRMPVPRSSSGVRGRSSFGRTAGAGVEVVQQVTVAGLDASVLRANDPAALGAWLAANQYPSSEALRAWLAPYVQRGWIVTAFKIDPGAQRGAIATRAVRMSFSTDTPFFPYSEPRASTASRGRPFRVSVVSSEPMRVRDGAGFGGRIGYRGRPAGIARTLRDVVPRGSFHPADWLTVFDEPNSVRGAHDLYFEPDPNGGEVPSVLGTRITTGN